MLGAPQKGFEIPRVVLNNRQEALSSIFARPQLGSAPEGRAFLDPGSSTPARSAFSLPGRAACGRVHLSEISCLNPSRLRVATRSLNTLGFLRSTNEGFEGLGPVAAHPKRGKFDHGQEPADHEVVHVPLRELKPGCNLPFG